MQAAKRAHSPAPLGRRGKAQAQFRQATGLQRQGSLAQAVAAYDLALALDPSHQAAHRARAATLTAMGRHEEALAAWTAIRTNHPDSAEVAAEVGLAMSHAGRHEAAFASLGAAARQHPHDPALLTAIGTVLLRLDRPRQAVGALLLAVQARPDGAQALSALGIAFLKCGDLDQARRHAAAAFQIAPDHDAAINYGRVLLDAGDFAQALLVSQQAVQLRGSLQARNNHALALEGLGRHEDAVQAWRAAVAVAPDDADTCHKLATLLLGLGRLSPETWALYERRLDGRAATGAVRRWRGEDVTGQTVLLHAEQGLGDTLQFVRYAPMVAARGARVVLAVQPSLVRLLGSVPGVDQVVAVGGALPHFDLFCPLLSLPAIFQTTLDTIPPPLAYDLPVHAPEPGDLRVGLVWAGNPGFVNDARRSVAPELLAPLTHLAGARFVSLQFGGGARPPGLRVTDAMAGVADFADTARRIAELDLVIAVDTAVAHLAATMGKPVWLLSRFLGCWRWLFDRSDSPWYPTMRIYRQAQPNDWLDVIGRVQDDLRRLLSSRAEGKPLPQLPVASPPSPRHSTRDPQAA